MDIHELIEFAEKYSNLGDAVQEQIKDILNGEYEQVNPNARKLIKDNLGGFDEELNDALHECTVFHGE